MPHIHVQYMRRWKHALPHFDVRICPECAALVRGPEGQAKHRADHDQTRKIWAYFSEKLGVKLDEVEEAWTWTAAVDGGPMELEAVPHERLQARVQRGAQSLLGVRDDRRAAGPGHDAVLPAAAAGRPRPGQGPVSDVHARVPAHHGWHDRAFMRAVQPVSAAAGEQRMAAG